MFFWGTQCIINITPVVVLACCLAIPRTWPLERSPSSLPASCCVDIAIRTTCTGLTGRRLLALRSAHDCSLHRGNPPPEVGDQSIFHSASCTHRPPTFHLGTRGEPTLAQNMKHSGQVYVWIRKTSNTF